MGWDTGWRGRNAILQKCDICGDDCGKAVEEKDCHETQNDDRDFDGVRGVRFAQEHMADTLRSGIVAEDSKQDTRAAIQQITRC